MGASTKTSSGLSSPYVTDHHKCSSLKQCSQFWRSEIQTRCNRVQSSGVHRLNSMRHSHLEALLIYTSCWQNSVLCSCRTEVMSPCWHASRKPLLAPRGHPYSWHAALSILKSSRRISQVKSLSHFVKFFYFYFFGIWPLDSDLRCPCDLLGSLR